MHTNFIRFGDLANETMFIYNFAVHEKLDETEALNCHTLKTETLEPNTFVEVLPE